MAEIRRLELVQHPAQLYQQRLHELFLWLIAQAFGDNLVQYLPGLCQQLQRFALNQISHFYGAYRLSDRRVIEAEMSRRTRVL
jgi:hypothetical protein